jgi:hypothetical protein
VILLGNGHITFASPLWPTPPSAIIKARTLASIGIMVDHVIDDDKHGVTSILAPNEIMKIGLKLVGFKR